MSGGELRIEGLHAGYGSREILHGIHLVVDAGTTTLLLGANGAGKSTTLGAVMGIVERTAGTIVLDGVPLPAKSVAAVVQRGVALMPEGGRVFRDLSVADNLRLGAFRVREGSTKDELDFVFDLFPRLQERISQRAGTLSGGERQMLAIGRALMSKPRLLLLDEPFLGLAPVVVEAVLEALKRIKSDLGLSMLVVEQSALALTIADRASILNLGEIVLETETPLDLLNDGFAALQEKFLG